MKRVAILLLFSLLCISTSFSRIVWEKFNITNSWKKFSDSELLLEFNKNTFSYEIANLRFYDFDRDKFMMTDRQNRVIFLGSYLDLNLNKTFSLNLKFSSINNDPRNYKYRVYGITSNGNELSEYYKGSIYFRVGLFVTYLNGTSDWINIALDHGQDGANYYNNASSWQRTNSNIADNDVVVNFDDKTNVVEFYGFKYNNIKNVKAISLACGSGAHLKVNSLECILMKEIEDPSITLDQIKNNIQINNDGICGIYRFDEYGDIAVVKIDGIYYTATANPGKNEFIHMNGKPTSISGVFTFDLVPDEGENVVGNYFVFDGMTCGFALTLDNLRNNVGHMGLKIYPTSDMMPNQSASSQQQASGSSVSSKDNNQYLASGSGVVISKDGVVVTNYHVVENMTTYDIVVNRGGKEITYKSKLLIADKSNDLALLKINDPKFKPYESIPFALRTTICDVGTKCFAMGFPMTDVLGEEMKVTDGIISSKTGFQGDVTCYQINASITHGNSGGPLFDMKGNLIGITCGGVKAEVAQNANYAIKSSYIKNLIESSPTPIVTPGKSLSGTFDFTKQIKTYKPYVVFIKVK